MEVADPFTFEYNLVAVNNIYKDPTSDSSSKKPPPKPRLANGPHQVKVPLSYTISDLYTNIASNLGVSRKYITIQFPCTEPIPAEAAALLGQDNLDPKLAPQNRDWVGLVGYSGYKYDPLATLKSLMDYWPPQGGKPEQMQVVAIPVSSSPDQPSSDDEDDGTLKKRLHLMGSMYDLYYTQENGRMISMSTLDSEFGARRKIYIRDCWQQFQIGVTAHFERNYSGPPVDTQGMDTLREEYLTDVLGQPSIGDEKLWRSIQETPDWIARADADISPFTKLVDPTLNDDQFYEAILVNGQPGTGKSQMLIYLIHRMMHLYEQIVCIFLLFHAFQAIIYVLPEMPVITILVDKSNQSDPIRVLSHPSSLRETLFTNGFPVIRIVDSVPPFAKKKG
ncbi:hypothetical protein BLNAU_17843 [Blattamonas nauphoetae]|uniref:DNA2/NAM7 helicase helicase domain-containing protein n=1 Tax=Blattamonas nauphoetae TaxID=2049346 RepID=A0ABQ9X631_9EUKA|nr:hypothetical protein BLNAU_17843 [Blattamonas nauphoetae]